MFHKILCLKSLILRLMLFFPKKLLHISFEKALSSYTFFDELLKFIKVLWEHPINNIEGYELIFPRSTNQRNMFYYIFFQGKKKCLTKP